MPILSSQITGKLSKKFLRRFQVMSVSDKKEEAVSGGVPTDTPQVKGKSEGSSKASCIPSCYFVFS
jgi:hypothetical protein